MAPSQDSYPPSTSSLQQGGESKARQRPATGQDTEPRAQCGTRSSTAPRAALHNRQQRAIGCRLPPQHVAWPGRRQATSLLLQGGSWVLRGRWLLCCGWRQGCRFCTRRGGLAPVAVCIVCLLDETDVICVRAERQAGKFRGCRLTCAALPGRRRRPAANAALERGWYGRELPAAGEAATGGRCLRRRTLLHCLRLCSRRRLLRSLLRRPPLQQFLNAAHNRWEAEDEGQHMLPLDAAATNAHRGATAIKPAASGPVQTC